MKIEEKGFINQVQRISNFINKIVSHLCLFSMASMTITVLLGVFFRYVFRMPLSWTEELSRYLMIWGASLAISMGIKEKGHVGLTIIMDKLNSRTLKSILETIVFILTAAFLYVMIYYSVQMVIEAKWQFSQGLGITMVLPTLAIPVSMFIGMIQLVLRYVIDLGKPENSVNEKEIIDI